MRWIYSLLMVLISTVALSQKSKREFRGVWIASVSNIDWPSKPGLSTTEQQNEIRIILDKHKAAGINAIIFQLRPCADAFYYSQLEPWSKWLTGKLDQFPFPYYDPLEFIIREAHQRGMELHGWFNPYRALIDYDKNGIDSASLVFQKPEWFVPYGKTMYFDPGLPESRIHTTNVIMDVVKRYDMDGVHFDDYFYPYRIANLEFPDSASFAKYGSEFSSREDWRRNNVDRLIQSLSDSIKKYKPHVQFGISPFGIWRNKSKDETGSDTRGGQTCYDDLYADVTKWLRKGWIDYVVPQLYWNIAHKAAPYEILVDWWNQNNYGKKLYIGQAAYRAGNAKDSIWKDFKAINDQLLLNQQYQNISGTVFFSSKSLTNNKGGIIENLQKTYYRNPALTPAVLSSETGAALDYQLKFLPHKQGLRIIWNEANANLSAHARYVVYRFRLKEKIDLNNTASIVAILPETNAGISHQHFVDSTIRFRKKYIYIVSSINSYNQESKPVQGYPVKVQKRFWRTYEPIEL